MKALPSAVLGLTALLAGLVAIVSLIGGKYLLAAICAAGVYGGSRLLARPQDLAARAAFALFCAGILPAAVSPVSAPHRALAKTTPAYSFRFAP